MMRFVMSVLLAVCIHGVGPFIHPVQASAIGERMQQMEKDKTQKAQELKNLEALEEIVANEIATAKAEMAQSMSSTIDQVGKSKASPEGLVTTSGGVVHSPSKHWVLDAKKLRKDYEQAGIYTKAEIDVIVEYHQSYTQNQGFTAGIAEQLAKVAEATAQQRTIQTYIARKKQEIRELENALQGSSPSESSAGGENGGGGGY